MVPATVKPDHLKRTEQGREGERLRLSLTPPLPGSRFGGPADALFDPYFFTGGTCTLPPVKNPLASNHELRVRQFASEVAKLLTAQLEPLPPHPDVLASLPRPLLPPGDALEVLEKTSKEPPRFEPVR